jgi:hypothetical protein
VWLGNPWTYYTSGGCGLASRCSALLLLHPSRLRVLRVPLLIAGLMYFARAVDSKIDEFTALKKRVEKLDKGSRRTLRLAQRPGLRKPIDEGPPPTSPCHGYSIGYALLSASDALATPFTSSWRGQHRSPIRWTLG